MLNAPNRDACIEIGQLWVENAPPPDLVTLFRPGFWTRQLGDIADVVEQVQPASARRNLQIGLRKVMRRNWRVPQIVALSESGLGAVRSFSPVERLKDRLEHAALRVAAATGLESLVPAQPAEFGLHIAATKRVV